MGCSVIGCIASICNEDSELGKQFLKGLNAIGPIFLPVAGIMAASPYISVFVSTVFGNAFSVIGADPSIAATTFIAVDMGAYQLAEVLAQTKESWIMATIIGYMAGATIVFSIPVALKIINKTDYKYLALGTMAGFITIPIGVLISCVIMALTNPFIRESISTNTEALYQLNMSFGLIFQNLIPLIIICGLIVIGLICVPNKMIKGFNIFGKVLDSALRLVVVSCIVEYFTGLFTMLLGSWGFNPIIADENNVNCALETAGYIGIMLSGAFLMGYLLQKGLSKPLERISLKFGISAELVTGILAGAANVLALFAMIENMKPEDKVKTLAFSVCGASLLGDQLSFTANYQPTLIVVIMVGKLTAGLLAVLIASKLIVPHAQKKNIMNL